MQSCEMHIIQQPIILFCAVEPLNFTCTSEVTNGQLMISDCISNNEVTTVEYLLNKSGQIVKKCNYRHVPFVHYFSDIMWYLETFEE